MNLEYEFDILWLSDNKLRRNEGINGVDVFLCYLYDKGFCKGFVLNMLCLYILYYLNLYVCMYF